MALKNWRAFKQLVSGYLDDLKANPGTGGTQIPPATEKPATGDTGANTTPYRVRVTVTDLRIRSGPGTDTAIKRFIPPGVYTIEEEAPGKGASKWGRLKSGAGWISLDYAKKL